jgi:hypothetical protein
MSILKKLQNFGSLLTKYNGTRPSISNFKDSKTHNTYSINGTPTLANKPSPSDLDLDGKKPLYNYRDNAPEGRTF